jgi:hypothetical protein
MPRLTLTASLIGLFTFVVCYFRAFVFPNIPVLPRGDQLGFLFRGGRLVAGEVPYRDFFEIIPAGTELVYALFIRLFGLYDWIPGLLMASLAAGTVILTTLIAGRLMRGFAIALPGLLLAGFVLPGSFDATHHWFSTIAVLGATLILLSGVTFPRIAGAGALCGLAACFTQSKGAVVIVAFVIYLLWKTRRDGGRVDESRHRCLVLCSAAAAIFLAVNVYFIGAAGLRQWLFCIIVYPLRYYSAPALNNWRVVKFDFQWHSGVWRWISFPFVYAAVPLAYLAFVFTARWRCEKDQHEDWDQLVLVALGGVAMLLAVALSPSLKRLSTVSPPALVILVWLLNQTRRITAGMKSAMAAAAVAMAIAAPLHTQTRWRASLDLPGGRTALLDPVDYEEYRWVLTHTHPGQFFFGMPPMYVPFHMRNPTAIDAFDDSEYTRPEQVIAAVQGFETHRIPMMILLPLEDPVPYPSDHRGPFREYMRQHYRLTKSFPNDQQVWEEIGSLGSGPSH